MKFSFKDVIEKNVFGMKIVEYSQSTSIPIDCAIAYFRNSEYPCKVNHNFYETFFILNGECTIIFDDEEVTLSKNDFFIIEPEKRHSSKAEFADVMICCVPPFGIKNVEFCKTEKNDWSFNFLC